MKIVIPDKISISEDYKGKLMAFGAQLFNDLPSTQELKTRIKDAELITANYIDITSEIIDAAPNLKYIVVPAVGYEWVDVDYATSKGITTLNCPTFNSQAVAEHAVTLLMAVNRNLITGVDDIRAAKWKPQNLVGFELEGKKLGLIGYGNVGKRIEKIVKLLGLEVGYVNSKSTSEQIDSLIKDADFVVVCAPLNENTRGLIGEDRLNMFKSTALIVNVGRGAIIDQNALISALEAKKIRGAGLDVFDGEPLTGTPNEMIVELSNLTNVIVTPHIAYNTEEINDKLGAEVFNGIRSCIDGQPINVVKQSSNLLR